MYSRGNFHAVISMAEIIAGLVGAIATIVAAIIGVRHHRASSAQPKITEASDSNMFVLGELVDIRELRVLRALYGESKGRILEGYTVPYYKPYLDATVSKGWVKHQNGRYHLTHRGTEVCRTYLRQLMDRWKPVD